MLEDKEMIGREDLLGICLPGHCSAIALCVCVNFWTAGSWGAGLLSWEHLFHADTFRQKLCCSQPVACRD